MAIVSIKELVEAGVHYGTKTSMWHPKMKPYIFAKRGNVYIVDLKKTAESLIKAYYYMSDLGKKNKKVLFVGTKRQAKDTIRSAAQELNMPFVAERWLGGILTNINTIRNSIQTLNNIEKEMADPEFRQESKKAQAKSARERKRILRNLEGVREMKKIPDLIVVIDPKKETTAVLEARKLNIPVIALVDTDCDPEFVNLPIPGNDDGIRSIQTIMKVLTDGFKHGQKQQVKKVVAPKEDAPAVKKEAKKADEKPKKKGFEKKTAADIAKEGEK